MIDTQQLNGYYNFYLKAAGRFALCLGWVFFLVPTAISSANDFAVIGGMIAAVVSPLLIAWAGLMAYSDLKKAISQTEEFNQ